MLVELKSKSQVTIPKEIKKSLAQKERDQFEIRIKKGKIILEPIVPYSQETIKSFKYRQMKLKKK